MTPAAVDPRRAYDSAAAMTATGDPATRVAALRALGIACKELGRLGEGLAHLGEALRTAESAGLTYATAQVKMNLVGLLTARGDIEAALAAADDAAPVLTGADADRLLANRACVLARSGRITEVVRIARTCTDPEVLVGLRVNTGLAKAYAGKLGRGESDLRAALAVAERAGLRHQAAMVRHNLAVVALRRGDLPRALALYDDVEPELAGIGERMCQLQLDRAEALIAARLPGEARELLARTLDRLAGGGYHCDTADALLLLAHAELADDDPRAAAATARRAQEAFGERAGFALLAEQVGLRARWADGDRSASLTAEAARAAE
ncbi:MAG: Tetratricopeptide 4, partial [Actinoallomurus sp.]|nr:Tetratricopeptide 4 [Actinoallomurus sp.]